MANKQCSKCEKEFACNYNANSSEKRVCWCENHPLNTGTLDYLRQTYQNCLCPSCLAFYEENQKNTCSIAEK